jgi:NAD(P)H-dependent FMN reductase
MDSVNILVVPGSARNGSYNRKLAEFASRRARETGLGITGIDLRALDLPVYDADHEAALGVPEGAYRLRAAILESDAVLVVTPEYNGFPTPLVINAFDWMSRIPATSTAVSGLAATANKPVGLLSASPGPGGALRSMNYMRQYLQMAFAMIVVPQQFALGKAHEAFDESGALKDARAAEAVGKVVSSLASLAGALRAAR